MLFNKHIRFVYFTLGFTLPIVAAFTLLQKPLNAQSSESINSEKFSPVPVQPIQLTQLELDPEKSSPIPVQPIQPTQPENARPLDPQNSLLSLQGGQRLMKEADNAITSENYDNQLSNFHSQLAASFSGIDNRLADGQRTKALETAQMRDQATYQLALVHRAQNQPELAVPLLVQIISSQQPTRDLGKKAYQQLLELGFVDIPYPRTSGDGQPPTSSQSLN